MSRPPARWAASAVIVLALSTFACAAADNDVPTTGTTVQEGEQPMPVEPDGGIGDGADDPMPVEPDGGIGDGTDDPMPVEPDGGIGDGAGPVEPTG